MFAVPPQEVPEQAGRYQLVPDLGEEGEEEPEPHHDHVLYHGHREKALLLVRDHSLGCVNFFRLWDDARRL